MTAGFDGPTANDRHRLAGPGNDLRRYERCWEHCHSSVPSTDGEGSPRSPPFGRTPRPRQQPDRPAAMQMLSIVQAAKGRSLAMASRICRNSRAGTITSAIWKIIQRPGRTILAPILTSRSLRWEHIALIGDSVWTHTTATPRHTSDRDVTSPLSFLPWRLSVRFWTNRVVTPYLKSSGSKEAPVGSGTKAEASPPGRRCFR